MVFGLIFAVLLFSGSAGFADQMPVEIKYFTGRVSDVEYDLPNDSYVLRRNPSAKLFSYVYTRRAAARGVEEPIKLQPGETYVLARGREAHFTQHQGVGCTVTFTNGVSELNGVSLPSEFGDSERQLLIQGNYEVGYRDYKKYAFVVNAEGEAYDVGTRKKFHFGIPFHAPKPPPRIDPDAEQIQNKFRKEGVNIYKKASAEPGVQALYDVVDEGATNVVSFLEEVGGIDEKTARKLLQDANPDYAKLLGAMKGAKRRINYYVAFCSKERGFARIVAVARVEDGPKCRMWCYKDGTGVPELIYSRDCQMSTGSFYEFGSDGLLRNLSLLKNGMTTSYYTMIDSVLQKSSDLQKAQAFMSKVEDVFNRYVELDTTGTLKPFVEKLRTQGEEAKAQQEKK